MTGQTTTTSALRWTAIVWLIGLYSLLALATPSLQEEERDSTRRLWNKRFQEARARTKAPEKGATSSATDKPKAKTDAAMVSASPADSTEGELIGITVWRLRPGTASDNPNKPRLLVQKSGGPAEYFLPERVEADTRFREGELVRLCIEVPRAADSYLYVIDREAYDDGTMGDPHLIFPAQGTPPRGNIVKAGKLVYIPAQGDPIPYFTMTRSRRNQVSERLTIIVSPEPLSLGIGPRILDPAQVAQFEKQWGGPTERREAKGDTGKAWTAEEKEADDGKRQLVRADPLPQTVYRVGVKPGRFVLVNLPLQVAPP